jgi:hypothetical protein
LTLEKRMEQLMVPTGELRESPLLPPAFGAAAGLHLPSNEGSPEAAGQGRIDKETFKRIFLDHWTRFKAVHPRYNTDYYETIIQKMLACGDPEKMGFAQYRCLSCGETRRVTFSCKCTFCLSCAKVYTDRWVDFIGRRLFPGIVYRHVILTVPKCLRIWFYRNPTILLSALMRRGHACLCDVFSTYKRTPLDIGSVIVLQTAGRPANYNPHLHIIVTAGGIDPNDRWIRVGYIPYELVHRKWQYHLLSMLREEIEDPAIERAIDHCWKTYPNGFVAHLQEGEVPPGGEGLAAYLAKYLVSPPISVRRIEKYDGRVVAYWYRDHNTGEIQHESQPVLTFIGRMVQHILPKGFQRIRYYGLHSHPRYEKTRNKLAAIVPSDMPPDPRGYRVLPPKPFAERFLDTFGRNPLLCPRCGEEMELELLQHPDYGIIKDFSDTFFEEPAFEESAHEQEAQDSHPGRRGVPQLQRPERVVQLLLPVVPP